MWHPVDIPVTWFWRSRGERPGQGFWVFRYPGSILFRFTEFWCHDKDFSYVNVQNGVVIVIEICWPKVRMGWQKRESAGVDSHDQIAVNRKLHSLSGCVVSQQTVSKSRFLPNCTNIAWWRVYEVPFFQFKWFSVCQSTCFRIWWAT